MATKKPTPVPKPSPQPQRGTQERAHVPPRPAPK